MHNNSQLFTLIAIYEMTPIKSEIDRPFRCTPHYSFSQMLEHILRTKWLAALAHLLCRFTLGDTVINLNLGTVQKFGLESLFFFKTDKLTHRRFCKVMHMCHTMVTTGSKNCTQSCHKCYCLHITTQNYSQLLQVLR